MNKAFKFLLFIFTSLFIVLSFFCSTDPEKNISHNVVGTWSGPCAVYGSNPIQITLIVESDSSGILLATEDTLANADTVFWYEGHWSRDDSLLYLSGDSCQKVDINNPQEGMQPFGCGDPVPIPIHIEDNSWKISVWDLRDIAFAVLGFPVPESMKNVFVYLEKTP